MNLRRRALAWFCVLWGVQATALAQFLYWRYFFGEANALLPIVLLLCFVSPILGFVAARCVRRGRFTPGGVVLLLSASSMCGYAYIGNLLAVLVGLGMLLYATLRSVARVVVTA